MSSETAGWKDLVNEASTLHANHRATLDGLEELMPLRYAPELAPSDPILLVGGWLVRCQREGLIDEVERTTLIRACGDAHNRKARAAFAAMESAKHVVTCATNYVHAQVPDGRVHRFAAINQAELLSRYVRIMLEASTNCKVLDSTVEPVATDNPSFPEWLPQVKIVLSEDNSEHVGLPVIDQYGAVAGILEGETFIELSWA